MIFNIQRFSLHDGDGVRTVIFFKGCPLRCAWCSNPESQSFRPEIMFDPGKCIGCRDCLVHATDGEIEWNNGPVFHREQLDASRFFRICPTEALTVAGEERPIADILRETAKDMVFYRGKGGITLSGGEPFAQPDNAAALLQAAKQYGLRTGVETCLAVPWANIEPSLDSLDVVYADVKHVDAEKYHAATGGCLSLPLDNLAKLAASTIPLSARIPVVPGFNDTEEELEAIIRHVAELGIRTAHLMAYHTFGKGKYALLGREYPLDGIPSMPPESLESFVARLSHIGPVIRIGG